MTIVHLASSGPPRIDYEVEVGGHPGAAVTQKLQWLQPTCVADVPLIWETYESPPGNLRAKIVFYINSVDLAVNSEGMQCQCNEHEGGGFCEVSISSVLEQANPNSTKSGSWTA